MSERARPVLAALSFLSAVPVGRRIELGERDLRRGAALFPAVGAAIGALVALVAWGSAHVLPAFAAAVLGVAAGVATTAALHLDGLGDVADGVGASLAGGDPAEAIRDPRLGTFGIAAIALDLLLKVSLLSALVVTGFPWPVVAAGALSRVAPVAMAWRLRYAGGGTGTWTAHIGSAHVVGASVVALALAIPSAGVSTIGMVAAVAISATLVGWWSTRRLGGITGDGFGAAIELGETLAIAVAVAVR
ncbi:MAG TPA: adenosylcobinamide-GDP ribazoletransferase [Actinomycetota bacterium]|nr:adenosylcobinamide-GDP ribazoletransferase [Actinomycetota bacterium]